MNRHFPYVTCVCVFGFFLSNAQITGTVEDSRSKKPVADVEVFIHGTSYFSITNEEGQFVIDGIQPGFLDLVLYKKGYELFKSPLRVVDGKKYTLSLSINPAKKEKEPKNGSAPQWKNELDQVEQTLLGPGMNGGCQILNKESIFFYKSPEGIVTKSASPLLINNTELGYQIRFYLFKCLLHENKTDISGYYTFQEMLAGNSEQIVTWANNRLKVYNGSLRHGLRSLVSQKSEEDGFQWSDENGTGINSATLAIPSLVAGYYKILLNSPVHVEYKTRSGELQSSELLPLGPLQVNTEGILLIPQNLEIKGPMNNTSMAATLPFNYEPVIPKPEDFLRFHENIYVQTDKPYYYPGEPLWFKGYIHYRIPSLCDSLSKVVYVEIISPQKVVTLSKMLKIDSGFFHGDFFLPDSLAAGPYHLRAYTQLNRNFGDQNLFVKPVPVLNMTDKVDRSQEIKEDPGHSSITFATDKKVYKTREKITLQICMKGQDGTPVASNLSVSVTDAIQVVPVAESLTMPAVFNHEKEKKFPDMKFEFPMEYGISFSGRFLNNKGKPEKSSLTIMQLKTRNVMITETNDAGVFRQTGFQFYDSAIFAFKSDKATNNPYGKVEFIVHEPAATNFREIPFQLKVQQAGTPQRIISEYEVPRDVRLLEEVEVKATRLQSEDDLRKSAYQVKHPYGRPDYVLKAKDLNTSYGNLLLTLPGKVPGLEVRQTDSGWMVYFRRSAAISIGSPTPVLVMVNNVVMGSDAGTILSTINPSTVESIEFTTRLNVLYGSAGNAGVISVYTKDGSEVEDTKSDQNFQTLKIPGYARPRKFTFPDYNDPHTDKTQADYRSTLYWNPTVVTTATTGTASFSFFASDLAGRYRVVVEGVTQNGETVRSVYFIEVEGN